MKQIITLIGLLAIVSGFGYSGNPVHGPLLIIDTSGANFGAIPNTGYHEHTFTLRNEGDAMLHISAVHPACGCTVASLKDSLVAPGGSTDLLIRFQENEHWPGGFQKEVSIASNSRDSSEKQFWFYGRFVAPSTSKIERTRTFIKPDLKGRTIVVPAK